MANAPLTTQVAVLREQTNTLHGDLSEMKDDIKQIKALLSEKFVTKEEFHAYKKTQNIQKLFIGVSSTVITAIITTEILKIIR